MLVLLQNFDMNIVGQRCKGRNFSGKRCCTPEQPCGLGEGDCDGPGDGGVNDGHAGCQVVTGSLVTERPSMIAIE